MSVFIDLTSGINVASQIPLDAKTYFKTLASMVDLGVNNYKAFMYHDSMVSMCVENKLLYIWRESQLDESGLIAGGFTYPSGSISNEINYSGLNFNFFVYIVFPEIPPNEDLGDRILNSGSVFWTGEELIFQSTVISSFISGVQYEAPETTMTLNPSHPTLNRIDVFVANDQNQVIFKTGIPAVNPLEPSIDFGTEVRINAAYIPADAIVPSDPVDPGASQTIIQVYNENVGQPLEYTTSTSSPSAILPDFSGAPVVGYPSVGVKCIRFFNVDANDKIYFTTNQPQSAGSVSSIAFDIGTNSAPAPINIKLINGLQQVGFISVLPNQFGHVSSTVYHVINIPFNFFLLPINGFFDKIEMWIGSPTSVGLNLRIDNIRLITGGDDPVQLNSYLSLTDTTDEFYAGKQGYSPRVNDASNALTLERTERYIDGFWTHQTAYTLGHAVGNIIRGFDNSNGTPYYYVARIKSLPIRIAGTLNESALSILIQGEET